jgi:hypothetical protein
MTQEKQDRQLALDEIRGNVARLKSLLQEEPVDSVIDGLMLELNALDHTTLAGTAVLLIVDAAGGFPKPSNN